MHLLSCLAFVLLLTTSAEDAHAERVHGIYAEMFGKGGLWGLGYDHRLRPRLSVGAVASIYSLDGQRVVSLTPYVGIYLVKPRPHAWFVDVGPQGVHTWTVSPVPEWDGHSDTGIAAGVSSGYEYRNRYLFRAFVHGAAGTGGVFPWLGASFGCAF